MKRLPVMPLSEIKSNTIKDLSELLSEGTQKIKAVLGLILGGDKQAAEYCLISLLSRVYKKEASFLIGNLPLNITGVNKEQSELIQKFLLSLCPLLSIFDSTTESLSESEWQPKKNYDTNKLNLSVLGEMPALSNLIIDESGMTEGKID